MTHPAPLDEQVDDARMWRDLEVFARYVKLSGSSQERESFAHLEAEMAAAGFETALIEHDAYISLPGAAALALEDGSERFECITHSFARATGPDGLVAEAVIVGAPTPENFAAVDLRGRIAVIDGLAASDATRRANLAGAVGQVHVMPHEHRHEMCISNIWGNPDAADMATLPATAVVTVNDADGARLKASLSGGQTRLRITAEVDTGWRKTPILQADLMPEGRPDAPFILFSGHHDTWYEGVMDNGGANATMLETARLIASRRGEMRRGLRLCFWSGHSHGRYSGSSWYADAAWAELSERCLVHVNVDSTGGRGNTSLADMPVCAELHAFGNEIVSRLTGQSLTGQRLSRAGDQSFWGIGVPSMFLTVGEQPIAEGTANVASGFMGNAGPARKGAGFGWWWHTPGDTLDKIDAEILRRDTRIYVETIRSLLTAETIPTDHANWASAMRGALAPLRDAPVLAELRLERSLALLDRIAAAAGPVPDLALRDLSHLLVPIDYTTGDRFRPDPALIAQAYPILAPLRAAVAAAEAGEEHRHHLVAARRSANRLAETLERAASLLEGLASPREVSHVA